MKSGKYSLGYTTVLKSLRSSKDNFKAKSDESEQDEAAVATTPDMNGRKVVCRSQTGILLLYSWGCFKDCSYRFVDLSSNSIDAILKLDEDRIITGSENGMINMVGILPNRIIQPIAEHSKYPVECLGNILLLFSQNLMCCFGPRVEPIVPNLWLGYCRNHSANSMFITINNLWDLDNILQGSRSIATSETGVVDNEVDSDDDDEMDVDNNRSKSSKASHLPFNRNGFQFFTNGGGLGKPDFKDILERVANIYNQFTKEGSLTLSKRIVSLSTKTIDYITVYTSYYIQDGSLAQLSGSITVEKVEELLDVSNICWNNQKLGVALSSASAISALQTPISWFNQTGSIFWPHVPSGEFTVKSGYHVLKSLNVVRSPDPSTSVSIDDIIWKELWGLNIPQKIKHFLWKACHNLLPFKDNLFKIRISISNFCPICNLESETVEHALLICPWTLPVRFGMQPQIVPIEEIISSFHQWFAQAVRFFGDLSSINSFGLVSFCLTLWSIWKGRNSVVFDNVHPNPMSTIQSTRGLIAEVHIVYSLKTSSLETQASTPHLNTSHTHSKPSVVWRLPLGDNLKLNTDASFFASTNSATSGVIVRN
ncbi:hypothetical protein P8452_38110 [Trifolium repens]|nr:hypothetical protein P8452_38110 [Trifolium repens]